MGRKLESKVVSLRTETAYKADRVGELAQRNGAQGSERALTKDWLWHQGVPNMRQQWIDLHYGDTASPVSL